MKFSVLLTITLAGYVTCENKIPTFEWVQDQFSPDGVPLLNINFDDGQADDVAILKAYNPIPKQASELESNVDKCIFNGHLRDESSVYVTLTGGCPFENTFDVMFQSERASQFMFHVREGKTSPVESIYKTKGLVRDIALKPPAHTKKQFTNPPAPNAYSMKLELNFDETFAAKFGDSSVNTIRRVATHAANMFTWSSIGTPITWTFTDTVYSIPNSIEASGDWLSYVGDQYNNAAVNSNVYMAFQNNQPGTAGIAWVGTICSSTNYRTAISEYFNNDMSSAEILAHEVGHNTGMDHDFNGSPGSTRYDSQGRSCTNIGAVMDYYQSTVNKWSSCSREDFANNDHSCI